MDTSLPLLLTLPILLITAWLYTAHLSRTSFPLLHNKRICLLIAHPDDEAMFFSPTITALTAPELGNHLKILCLSTGNADGLGATRQKELLESAKILGLRDPASDIFVINSPSFPDSMSASWSSAEISNVLSSAFIPSPTAPAANSAKPANGVTRRKDCSDAGRGEAPVATIDVLITFDGYGVSGHSNHISLYHGAKAWLKAIVEGKDGWGCPVNLYTLSSTNVIRKYLSALDAPVTLLWGVLRDVVGGEKGKRGKRKDGAGRGAKKMFFVNDLGQHRRAQKAMTEGHRSQMRWFRWGWIGVGRFMVVNDLRREKI